MEPQVTEYCEPESERTSSTLWQGCSVRILSSRSDILALRHCGLRFPDNSAEPTFFLGTVACQWRPVVAVVSREPGRIAGLVYLRERLLAGRPSGILHGDGTFGTMVIGADRERVLEAALHELLSSRRKLRGIRLVVEPGSEEDKLAQRLAGTKGWDVSPSQVESYHVYLPLPGTYQAFLEGLGSRTRRNLRHHRREFEAAGHHYLDRLSLDEYRTAARELREQCTVSSGPGALEQTLQWSEAVAEPWMVGLRHQNGEWLGVCGGCSLPGRAIMFLQLNRDRQYQAWSLSNVLRAYLIESLIDQGCPELVFWLGAAGSLARYTRPYPARRLYLDRPSWPWRAIRWTAARLGPRVSQAQWHDLSWLAPLSPAETSWNQEA